MSVTVPNGYKQTKVGVIPEDWEVVRLGDVLTIGSGKDYKHLSDGDIPVFGTGGYMLSVNDYLYDGESVCIGRKGTIDKPIFLTGKFWTVDTLFYSHSYRNSIPKFLYFTFLQINWKKYNEASGVPSLSKNTIETIKIKLPPLKEQQKIAQILTTWDKAIAQQEAHITAKEELKKGLMQKLLSGEVRFDGFDGFDGEWEIMKLGDVTKVNQGLQIPISQRFLEDAENRYFYITVQFLKESSKEKYFIENPQKNVVCTEDDILMTRTGSTGMVITNVSGAFHNNFFKINFDKDKLFRDFLFYFLTDEHTQFLLKAYAGTTTIPDLTHNDFYSIKISLPSLEEQQKIAQVLTLTDKEIDLLKTELEALKEQKHGLMQKLLTGEVRTNNIKERE